MRCNSSFHYYNSISRNHACHNGCGGFGSIFSTTGHHHCHGGGFWCGIGAGIGAGLGMGLGSLVMGGFNMLTGWLMGGTSLGGFGNFGGFSNLGNFGNFGLGTQSPWGIGNLQGSSGTKGGSKSGNSDNNKSSLSDKDYENINKLHDKANELGKLELPKTDDELTTYNKKVDDLIKELEDYKKNKKDNIHTSENNEQIANVIAQLKDLKENAQSAVDAAKLADETKDSIPEDNNKKAEKPEVETLPVSPNPQTDPEVDDYANSENYRDINDNDKIKAEDIVRAVDIEGRKNGIRDIIDADGASIDTTSGIPNKITLHDKDLNKDIVYEKCHDTEPIYKDNATGQKYKLQKNTKTGKYVLVQYKDMTGSGVAAHHTV